MKTATAPRSIFTIDAGEYRVLETGDGFLKAKVTIARLGAFSYVVDGDVVWKAKLPEDLFSPQTIDSVKGAPVTEDHPTDASGRYILLTPENATLYTRGSISEPYVDGDKLCAFETVIEKGLIDKINRGEKREVSIGFTFDEDEVNGTYAGKFYTRAQRNIRINHLAHVDKGRGGPEVRIHVDKEDAMPEPKATAAGPNQATDGKTTYTYRCADGKDVQVDQVTHSELMALKSQAKTAVDAQEKTAKELDDAKKALEAKQVGGDAALHLEVDGLKAKLQIAEDKATALTAALKKAKDEMPALVMAAAGIRKQIESDAESVGVKHQGLDDRQVKLQICAAKLPFRQGVNIDALDDSRIDAQYEAAMDLARALANKSKPGGDGASKGKPALDAEKIQELRNKLSNPGRKAE